MRRRARAELIAQEEEDEMATWDEFAADRPEIAAMAHELLRRTGIGEGMLATVAADSARIHPVYAEVVDGRLVTFVASASAKARDLEADARYAFHTHLDPVQPHEFAVRGRARFVEDSSLHQHAVDAWAFDAADGYRLVELDIDRALLGRRPTADDWPPVYESWRTPGARPAS